MILSFNWVTPNKNEELVLDDLYTLLEKADFNDKEQAEIISCRRVDLSFEDNEENEHEYGINIRTHCESCCARISIALDLTPHDVEINS